MHSWHGWDAGWKSMATACRRATAQRPRWRSPQNRAVRLRAAETYHPQLSNRQKRVGARYIVSLRVFGDSVASGITLATGSMKQSSNQQRERSLRRCRVAIHEETVMT